MIRFWRYFGLSADERRLFWQAVRQLRQEEHWMRQSNVKPRIGETTGDVDLDAAKRIGHAVRRAAKVTRSKCLAQALAGQELLSGQGLQSVVDLGGKHGDDGFTAHAWLKHDGVTLLGGAAGDYVVFREDDT